MRFLKCSLLRCLQLELKLLSTQSQYVEQGSSRYQKQIVSLQLITILWMCAEAAIAILAALRAHSVALLGFGAASGIELMSAFAVLLRFKKIAHINEEKAVRITGLLLFALAAFILGSSILAFTKPSFRPEPSYMGMALLIAAGMFMPWLSAQKEKIGCPDQQRLVEGRCGPEFDVRIPGLDCVGRLGCECGVQNFMG